MTPEDLRVLFESNPTPQAFAEAFRNLTEADRKPLSKTAQELFEAVRKKENRRANPVGPREQEGSLAHEAALARLAVLACCPWGQAKRINLVTLRTNAWAPGRDLIEMPVIRQILIDRRPSWADDWVALQLDFGDWAWQSGLYWTDVRELMKAGVIQRPTVPGYVRLMAEQGFQTLDPDADADVIEIDLWMLFAVDTVAFDWLPDPETFDPAKWREREWNKESERIYGLCRWPGRLYGLAQDKLIDRNRLIDAALAALWQDFRTAMLTGLLRFLEIMKLTDDEVAAREAAYRELLRNTRGTVVAMALAALGRLSQTNRLDAGEFLKAVPAIFGVTSKAQPKAALSMIGRMTKTSPNLLQLAARAVAPALRHSSPDIQEQAIELLEKWASTPAPLHLAFLSELAPIVAAPYRVRLEQLAGTGRSSSAEISGVGESPVSSCAEAIESRKQALLERFTALPESLRVVTCLQGLDEALRSDELPPAFKPVSGPCPVLSSLEPIEPIRDVDELIDAVLHLFEVIDRPEEFERVLDGLMRLGDQVPADFDAKTAGLRHLKIASNWDFQRTTSLLWETIPNFIRMIGFWVGATIVAPVRKRDSRFPVLQFLDDRCERLLCRLRHRQFGIVLSTPTHRGGWIDPRVFVARVRTLLASGQAPDQPDLICGLLRLTPDFREASLRGAQEIPDDLGRIVRYALGGEARPSDLDRRFAPEWLAAARARSPIGNLTDLRCLGENETSPDGITSASFEYNRNGFVLDEHDIRRLAEPWKDTPLHERVVKMYQHDSSAHVRKWVKIIPNEFPHENYAVRPTVALAAQSRWAEEMAFAPWQQELISSTWPANANATLAIACCDLTSRIDKQGSTIDRLDGWLSPLCFTDQGWSDIGRTALWLGLLSRDDQARGIAIDALIDGIADGRADVNDLAASLIHIAIGGWIKLNRLSEALREVTRTSLLAERIVSLILDQLIASWKSLPRDAHHVLELELELLASLGQSLSEAARMALAAGSGSGKTARLMKKLCDLKPDPTSNAVRESVLTAAEGRLARAERIHRYLQRNPGKTEDHRAAQ